MTINRDFAENLRAGGDLSGSFDVTGDLATFDNLTVNTAATVPYDNSVSGLTAANIQSAITELNTLVGGGNVGSQATWNVYEFTTVGNDTQFDISSQGSPAPSYVPGYVKVYLNGLLLSESDYTAVDGSTVNFSPAIVDSGQIVSIVVMDSFNTAELLRVTSIDASASTNTLVIDSNSRVGIGTTSPFAKLSISGTSATANDQGIFQITDGTGANTDTKIVMGVVNSDYSWIQSVKPGTDNLDLILNPNGGNVGIGSTSPNGRLSLGSTIGAKQFLVYDGGPGNNNNNLYAGMAIDSPSSNDFTIYAHNDGLLKFGKMATDGSTITPYMTIDNSGNVGIGTTSPVAPLTVSGNNFISWVDSAQGGVRTNEAAGTTASVTGYALQYKQNVGLGYHSWETSANTTAGNGVTYTEHMRIDSSGNIITGGNGAAIFLEKQGTATDALTQFSSDELKFAASGWDTNGSVAKVGAWMIRNDPVASIYPDFDLNFYDDFQNEAQLKVSFHARGTANHADPKSATFYGDVYINQGDQAYTNAGDGNLVINNGNLKLESTSQLQFNRGSNDFSNYIRPNNYPSQGYTTSTDKYWIEYGAKGGHHFILNSDGGATAPENTFDHFTVWQGAIDGDKLFHVTNAGNATFAGDINISGNSRSITMLDGTTSSQPSIAIGEQSLYGFRQRWDSGSKVQFEGWWASSVSGATNRDFGSLDANNLLWTFNTRVGINTSASTTYNLQVNGNTRFRSPAADQAQSEDSGSVPSTTVAEMFRLEGSYNDGTYTHEFAKIDRVGNLPLYLRESRGVANSFTNIVRFGSHSNTGGGANRTNTLHVFGDMGSSGAVKAVNFLASSADQTPESVAFNNTLAATSSANRVVYFDGNGSYPSTWYGNGNTAYGAIDVSSNSFNIWIRQSGVWNNIVDVSTGGLFVDGNITASGSISDIRKKENIEVIPEAMEKIKKLDGITFNYKKNGVKSTGLIAQQVMEVLPEVVYETEEIDHEYGEEPTEEKTYAINYGNIVGLLVEGLKEQDREIQELKQLVHTLLEK